MQQLTYPLNNYNDVLIGKKIPIDIDPTNFDCDTCDRIFEQVFAFVNQNYIGDERNKGYQQDDIDLIDEFDGPSTDTVSTNIDKKDDGLTDKIFAGLNDVAKSELTNKFNELNKKDDDVSRVDEEVTNNILTGLKEKAMNEFTRKFEKDVAPEVDDELTDEVLTNNLLNGLNDVAKRELINEFTSKFKKDDDAPEVHDNADEVLTNNILTGLKEKAMNELKNQINVLPKNETAELVDIVNKEEYKDDSKEDDESLLDKNNTKLTITIKDPNNKNKKTKQKLTVKEIIDNLNNKIPSKNRNVKKNDLKNINKKTLIKDLNNATTVGKAVKILKNNDYNVNPKYNQYYNEFINTLYGRHPFSGGDNIEDEV